MTTGRFITALRAVTLAALGALAQPAAAQDASYTLDVARSAQQVIAVRVDVPNAPGDSLTLAMPVWRPGRYEVLDPSGTVSRVRASAGDQPLPVEKLDKSTWRVALGAAPSPRDVRVEYDVYANALSNRTRHADDTHVFVSPSAVLMYVPDRRRKPARVSLEGLPPSWTVATGLARVPGDEWVFDAPDYDVLADSPLEAGPLDRWTFNAAGAPHEIAFWWGPTPSGLGAAWPARLYDRDRLSRDFASIVAVQHALFGRLPYDRYVFLVHCAPGLGGGTEHLNSTIMQTGPKTFETAENYRGFLTLVSHEMFHTWNVKQFRPAGLSPYDYTRENYTDLLWVAEGTTSYYESLVLVRAGLLKPDDYLKALAKEIDAEQRRPGGRVQSVASAGFDAWVKFNRPTPDDPNTTVSFYDKGAHVSWMLDMAIREGSSGRASLDGVMRDLFERFPYASPGYTDADVRAAATRAGALDVDAFFARFVQGVEPLDYDKALAVVGLRLERTPPKPEEGEPAPETLADPGFTLTTTAEPPTVRAVASDGPAHAAGLLPGDVLLAINGVRVRSSDWERVSKRLQPDEPLALSVFRSDLLRTVEFRAGSRPSGTLTIKHADEPTPAQRDAYASWLGQPWPEPAKSDETPSKD